MSYKRYYRRPYYNRRPSPNPFAIALLVILLLVFGFIVAVFSTISNPNNFAAISAIFSLLIFAGFLTLIYKIIQKIFTWINGPSQSRTLATNNSIERIAVDINTEKHGCKCYMEGLTTGEKEVANALSRELNYKDYFIFNNLIIPCENNGSTQIDHIVVSRFGIFVIESKDFNGWIFGQKDDSRWTQSLAYGKNKTQFQNPIHQNYAHIMALKELMPFVANNLVSIVVFSGKSEIKTPPIWNVIHLSQLIETIKSYSQQKLSESDLQLVIGKLSYACQTVDITTADHIANIQAHKLA